MPAAEAVLTPFMGAERAHREIADLADAGQDLRSFVSEASRAVARAVPFDGFCVVALDPATLLPTAEVVENGLPPAEAARLAEMEAAATGDVNMFAHLAQAASSVASLSEATGGRLERSARHRELRRPNGFGDELRAVLVGDAGAWGALTLLRAGDGRSFSDAEIRSVAGLVRPLEAGMRRAALVGAAPRGDDGEPGVVVLGADGVVVQANAAGRALLDELRPDDGHGGAPVVVRAVVSRARAVSSGTVPVAPPARARVLTTAGRWLTVHGSALDEGPDAPVAVVLEATRPAELAPMVAGAHGLTRRERAVTGLLVRGASDREIARSLRISQWTVHDHVKAVFAKTGATSRGELVARLLVGLDGQRRARPEARPGGR